MIKFNSNDKINSNCQINLNNLNINLFENYIKSNKQIYMHKSFGCK